MKTIGQLLGILIVLIVAPSVIGQTESVPQAIQHCRADIMAWSKQGAAEDDKLGYGTLEDRANRMGYCYSIDPDYGVETEWPKYVRDRASVYMLAQQGYNLEQAVRDRDFIKRHDLGGQLRQEDAGGER